METLKYTFIQNALIGVILISISAAIIGTYVVTRRMVFISGGITHACFGGLGLGYYLGISPIAMASVIAVISGVGVEYVSRRQHIREDSAIAVIWALGMAVGTLFIFLTPGYVPELNSFLFGSILTINYIDLSVFLIYTIVLVGFFIIFYKQIIACAFDRDFAKVASLPERFINYSMMVLIAICIVLTIKLIGVMLLLSLFTLPQMIAELFYKRFSSMIYASVAISAFSGLTGLMISYYLNVPSSATIVITLVVLYTLARLIKRQFTTI
ncbi:MAG: metal ABC transporter permease [Bacteroidales bacterium]